MKALVFLLLTAVSSMALATISAAAPQAVPVLEGWGMLALGAGVALAGVIGAIRVRKK